MIHFLMIMIDIDDLLLITDLYLVWLKYTKCEMHKVRPNYDFWLLNWLSH